MEQGDLLALAFAGAGNRRRKRRLGVSVPFCEACQRQGRRKRDWKCKACCALYQAAWQSANPALTGEYKQRASKKASESRRAAIIARFGSFEAYVEHSRQRKQAAQLARAERARTKQAEWRAAHPERVKANAKVNNAQKRRVADAERARRAEALRAMGVKSHVYFFELMPGGPVKIGWTTTPVGELLKHAYRYAPFLSCIATIAGWTHLEEKELHRRFEHLALGANGKEWFHRDAELMAYIAKHATPWCERPAPL